MYNFKKLWGNFDSTPQNNKYQAIKKEISSHNAIAIIKNRYFWIKYLIIFFGFTYL